MSIFDFLSTTKTNGVNHKGIGLLFHVTRKEKKVTAAINITNRHSGAQPQIVEWVKQTLQPDFMQVVDFKGLQDLTRHVKEKQTFDAIHHVRMQRATYLGQIIANHDDSRLYSLDEILVFTFTPEEHVMFKDVTFEAHSKIAEYINTILNNTQEDCPFPLVSLSILKECHTICTERKDRSLDEKPPVWRLSMPYTNGIYLANEVNDISTLDFFSSPFNYNCFSAFGSGVESRFFHTEAFTNILARNGRAVVIDKDYGYEHFCRMVKGDFSSIDPSKNSINPLWGITNLDALGDMPLQFLIQVGELSRPISRDERDERDELENALVEAFHQYGAELELKHVYQLLEKVNEELANLYKPFTSGHYQNLFNGEPSVDFSNALTVLNLKPLMNTESVRQLAVTAISLSSYIALSKHNDTKNMLFISDADALAGEDSMKPILSTIASMASSQNLCLMTHIASLASISKSQTINLLYKNSAWFIASKSNKEDIIHVEKAQTITSPETLAGLRSTMLRHDKYTELLIKHGKNQGKFKYFLDPHSFALFSNNTKHTKMISDYEQTHSISEAINILAALIKDKNKQLFSPS